MRTAAILAVATLALSAMLWAADDAVTAPQQGATDAPITNDMVSSTDAITIPQMLSYQGRLTDASGVPVVNGDYSVVFKLYVVPVGGSPFWSETQRVTTRDGLFSVLLGSLMPITTGDGEPGTGIQAAYLSMTVEGDAEMLPRLRIAGAASTAELAAGSNPRGGTDADDAWVRIGSDSVLYTIRRLGIVRGGSSNKLYGSYGYTQTIFGSSCTTGASGANVGNISIGGGYGNRAWAPFTTVCGGRNNKAGDAATDTSAIVVGGYGNQANAKFSYIAGGQNNIAGGTWAAIGGGKDNAASAIYSAVGGGDGNTASGDKATVGGGAANVAAGHYSTVGGGVYGDAGSWYAAVGGGYGNAAGSSANDTSACVAGGRDNSATAKFSFVGGGKNSTASGIYSTVGGGIANIASGTDATIGGGYYNTASGLDATVGGGNENTAGEQDATVGGGAVNAALGAYSTVGGGVYDTASGEKATVSGGYFNSASAYAATVAGGLSSHAQAAYSFAVGNNSNVSSGHDNSAAFNGQTTTASGQTRVGALSKASGTFTIDHPLDPNGKILNHYFVESPDMSNVYSGSVVLDAEGRGQVRLPDYFEALNRNPRVQLTGVGTSDVYVAEKPAGNCFVVGGKPGIEVYWQVTGDRKDPSAEITRHIMPVEQQKTGSLAGHSLDDDFLRSTKDQLDRMGVGGQFDFRTGEGRKLYEKTKQPPQKHRDNK